MLSITKVFCFFLIHYFVYGNFIPNQPSKYYGITKAPQQFPGSIPPSKECAPNKSLNSKSDIKVMIDHIYNEKSLDKIIKQKYQPKAEAIRDKHLRSLNYFTGWFENQPVHLKHVLQRLERLRKVQVEPVVKTVADILSKYPKLETLYNEKSNKANELLKKFNRFNMICKLNCEDRQAKEHNIAKRNVRDDFYCSSLEDLHKMITQNLEQFVENFNNVTITELSLNDTKFEEKINQIKSRLKDKALKEFGQTMYDILFLEDNYHHFMDDMTSTDLDVTVYNIKTLGLSIDTKLLQLEQAIEKYSQYCSTCGSKILVRNVRRADLESEGTQKIESLNVVTELLDIKFEEIAKKVESDSKNIFNDLHTLIHKTETEEVSFQKLKPIREEIKTITNAEKEALDKLKNLAPAISIKQILELIKKLQDLLKRIQDILDKLPK